MLVGALLEHDALGLLVHRLAAFDEKARAGFSLIKMTEGRGWLIPGRGRRALFSRPLLWPPSHAAAPSDRSALRPR